MKLKINIIILLTFLSFNSSCQNNNFKKESMKYFDIKKYEQLEVDNNFTSSENDLYYKTDFTRIRILYFDNTIQVEETDIQTPYKFVYVYDKNNRNLRVCLNFIT